MKKLLLLLTMLVVVGISSYADDYTITFKSTANGATEIKPTTKGSTFVESTSTQYLGTTAVAAASKVYYGGQTTDDKNALRFNTTSAKGTITFNLSDVAQVNATSVILSCKLYGTSDAATKVKVNGNESTTEISNTSDYEDIEVSLGGSKLTTLTIENSNSGKYRFYLKSIKVVSGNGGDTPDPVIVTPPTITINGEKQGNDYLVGATATISAETEMIQYTLDGTTPTVDNGELYTEPLVLDKAQKYTIKAIALDDDFNASEVKTLEVNVVEKTVTPPAGDTGTVVFIADGYNYTGTAPIKVYFSGTQDTGKTIADQTWIADGVCELDFTATSKSTSYVTGSVCRWYSGDGITITPMTGYKITGLKMKSESGNNSVCSNNKAKLNAINNIGWTYVSTTEATWTGSITEAFTFTNTAQVRFQYLEVTYEKVPVGPVVDKPVITITGEKSGEDYLIGATASISAPNASYIFYTTDGSDPKAEGNTAVKEVEGTSVDLGTLALGETTIKAYIWDADANSGEVETITVNVVKKPAELKWSSDQCKVYLNETPTFPTLSHAEGIADNEIVYSIPEADNGVATIDAATGEITIVGKGTTTVTAKYTAPEGSDFADGEASYTLTVTERPAGDSMHATSYLFDFTADEDFRGLGSYGMKFFSQTYSGTEYETSMENPVTQIIRKGVTLDFIVPEGIAVTYRLYQGTEKKQGESLRVYNAKLQFSVPAPGRIKSIIFHKSGDNKWTLTEVSVGEMPTKWADDGTATWTAPENESISSVWFNFNGDKHTRFTGITVEYDLQKPAMPYVVSETADAIVVECDDWCELHYTKKPESAAKAPSRAQLNDGTIEDTDEWYNHGSYQITIDKNNTVHQDRGYSFIANHAETGLKSDALNLYVGSDGTLTGVEGISAEADANAPVEFYDLQGRMVANPQGGIFIRRQGSKVTKVAM